MDVQRYGFLTAILGEDGAQALAKVAERSPALATVLVPRAILAWLGIVDDFEGQLPGVENTYVSFSKAEGAYTGTFAVGDTSYGIQDASPMHLAASLGIALGLDAEALDPALKDVDLQRLGRSIDLLVKARKAVEDLGKRQLDPNAGFQFTHQHQKAPWGVSPSQGKFDPMTRVFVHPPGVKPAENNHVGYAAFRHLPGGEFLEPAMVVVNEGHQRQGIASAIYAHAEKVTGKKVVPGREQTPEGQALWQGNAVKPQFGTEKMEKSIRLCVCGHGFASKHSHPPDFGCDMPGCKCTGATEGKALKAEAPGAAAAPQAQGAPLAPTAPQKQPRSNAVKSPPRPSVKLTMSEARASVCPVCALPQFQGERFVGCLCFTDLAKSTTTERTPEGLTVSFGPEWDPEAMDVFVEGLRPAGHGR